MLSACENNIIFTRHIYSFVLFMILLKGLNSAVFIPTAKNSTFNWTCVVCCKCCCIFHKSAITRPIERYMVTCLVRNDPNLVGVVGVQNGFWWPRGDIQSVLYLFILINPGIRCRSLNWDTVADIWVYNNNDPSSDEHGVLTRYHDATQFTLPLGIVQHNPFEANGIMTLDATLRNAW